MLATMELCVDSLTSVSQTIEFAKGENRYEVCSNLLEGGGLTPSLGLVRIIRKRHPEANLMIMIRPRSGSFVYSEDEILTMASDILAFKEEGVKGFVFGCLTKAGEVDVSTCRRLLIAAAPLPVTFHRAFDVTPDWRKSFETIVSLKGFTSILTSGQARTALEGAWILNSLTELSSTLPDNRNITIIPASGINDQNIQLLRKLIPGMKMIHLSGSGPFQPDMTWAVAKGQGMGFGSGEEWRIDRDKVRRVWEVVRKWNLEDVPERG